MKIVFNILSKIKVLQVFLLIIFRYIEISNLSKKDFILTRTACLGNDSIGLLNLDYKIIPHQKCRVDLLCLILNGLGIKNFSPEFSRIIPRTDIFLLCVQQAFLNWNFKMPPKVFIIDSYSELTDQKFILKSNPSKFFFSNFSDIDSSRLTELELHGLLTEDEIADYYHAFFTSFRNKYPLTPIIYIHYPKKNEKRDKFRNRHDFIKSIVNHLTGLVNLFYVIEIPETIVDKNEEDDFPYHYSTETYKYVSNSMRNIFIENNISF